MYQCSYHRVTSVAEGNEETVLESSGKGEINKYYTTGPVSLSIDSTTLPVSVLADPENYSCQAIRCRRVLLRVHKSALTRLRNTSQINNLSQLESKYVAMLFSMLYRSSILFLLGCLSVLVKAAPGTVGSRKNPSWKDMDLSQVFPPNPPVTHRVLMTIEYYDAKTEAEKEHEITIELYGTVTPKTVNNFVALSHGVKFKFENTANPDEVHPYTFKNSNLHKIIANKLIQGGDVFENSAPISIYGPYWPDENFDLKHDRPGRLSMANNGPNTQGSEFFIVTQLDGASEFDSKNVVFGQVVAGLEGLVDDIQFVETDAQGKPVHNVKLKYILVDQLMLGNKEELHADYLTRLGEFQKGDLSKGVTMGVTMATGAKEEKAMDEMKFNDLHHPLFKVLLGMGILFVVYTLTKFRKRVFFKSSNIVSLRRE